MCNTDCILNVTVLHGCKVAPFRTITKHTYDTIWLREIPSFDLTALKLNSGLQIFCSVHVPVTFPKWSGNIAVQTA